MTETDVARPLLETLQQLLPDAEFSVLQQNRWCSLSNCGTQMSISAIAGNDLEQKKEDRFAQFLAEHEFTLHGHVVVDIALVERITGTDYIKLIIEALVLKD